jgi:hypothetical protein
MEQPTLSPQAFRQTLFKRYKDNQGNHPQEEKNK